MRKPIEATVLFSTLLLLDFFLPWIGVKHSTLSGWQIPREAPSLKGIIPDSDPFHLMVLMYIIPVLCIAGLYRKWKGLTWRHSEYPVALVIAACFWWYKKHLTYLEHEMTFRSGYFVTIATALIGLLYVRGRAAAMRRRVAG